MRVVLFGDSLTEGIDGVSYVTVLRQRLSEDARLRAIELVNAGVGGDTVLNLLRRAARDVVPLAPDWVVVEIGVNDATTLLLHRSLPTLGRLNSRRYFRRVKGISTSITPHRYTDGLRLLVETLRHRTTAHIALCTPFAHGERMGTRAWRLLDRYADAVRLVADERRCAVIDLHATLAAALADTAPQASPAPGTRWLRAWGVARDQYDALAVARGLTYTYDGLHPSTAGAVLIAEVFVRWLDGVVASSATAPEG